MNSIFHRISVRKYEDRPVEKEKIMEILKAGMQAPSACNQQPWEFFVVTDKEKIQKLSKVTPYTGCAAGAPVVIVPVYHTEGLVAPSFAQIDMAIAQQNIWLETDMLPVFIVLVIIYIITFLQFAVKYFAFRKKVK